MADVRATNLLLCVAPKGVACTAFCSAASLAALINSDDHHQQHVNDDRRPPPATRTGTGILETSQLELFFCVHEEADEPEI